jgi:hypothetical protein
MERGAKKLYTSCSLLCKEIVGLFTLDAINKDEFIINYAGEVVNPKCPLISFMQEVNDNLGRSYGFSVDL